jgi:drug/metabolite transporter (DMT)-like permease
MTNQKRAYIYAIITILLWSTIASAFKVSLNYLDYFQLLFFASVFSCIILLFIMTLQGKLHLLKKTTRQDLFHSAFLGILNPFLYYLALLKAYSLLKAQEAGTLNYIWPIILVLLAVPLLKQRIHWLSIMAILISFIGIMVISTEGKIKTLEFKEPLGVLLAIVSSIFWALFWIFNLKDKRDEVVKLFINFAFGSMYVLIALVCFSGFSSINIRGLSGALYIGLFEMGLTYVLWLKALKLSSNTATISNMVYLSPFISLIVIRSVIGEKILLSTVVGLVLIISGIAVQQFSRKLAK